MQESRALRDLRGIAGEADGDDQIVRPDGHQPVIIVAGAGQKLLHLKTEIAEHRGQKRRKRGGGASARHIDALCSQNAARRVGKRFPVLRQRHRFFDRGDILPHGPLKHVAIRRAGAGELICDDELRLRVSGKRALEFGKFLKAEAVAEFHDGLFAHAAVFGQRRDREKRDLLVIFHDIVRDQPLRGGEPVAVALDPGEDLLYFVHRSAPPLDCLIILHERSRKIKFQEGKIFFFLS